MQILKQFKALEVVFFVIIFVGFYQILPNNLGFDDATNTRLLHVTNLINYLKSNHAGSYAEFFRAHYSQFHGDKIDNRSAYSKYSLVPNSGDCGLQTLFRYLFIYFLFFESLDVEHCFLIVSMITTLLTYIYACKLGKLFWDNSFGLILAVFITSNVYFNQLTRSLVTPQITLYPLLFLAVFYYFLVMHQRNNPAKSLSVTKLSIALSCCLISAYPNTNVILPGYFFFSLGGLMVYVKLDKIRHYEILPRRYYIFLIVLSLAIVILITGSWSLLLGENFFFTINRHLHSRVWGHVLGIEHISHDNIYTNLFRPEFSVSRLKYVIKNLMAVLFFQSAAAENVHSMSYLMGLSYLNVIEAISFLIGFFYVFKNMLSKDFHHFLFFLFTCFFLSRAYIDRSIYFVSRVSFDYIFITTLLSSYGFYSIIKSNIFSSRDFIHFLFLSALLGSAFLNIFRFNQRVVWDFEEHQGLYQGIYQLRKIYNTELSQGKNLLLLPMKSTQRNAYSIDNITFLQQAIAYEDYSTFFEKESIQDINGFKYFLQNMDYDNLYIVLPTGILNRRGNYCLVKDAAFMSNACEYEKFFSYYTPYKKIVNRKGVPLFWIYKFSFSHNYFTMPLKKDTFLYQLRFKTPNYLDALHIPAGVKTVELIFDDKESLRIDLSNITFQRFYFSFDKNSIIDIFNVFQDGKEIAKIDTKSNITYKTYKKTTRVRLLVADEPQGVSEMVLHYVSGYNISKAFFMVPFVFMNDLERRNHLAVSIKTEKVSSWQLLFDKISNGNMYHHDYSNSYQSVLSHYSIGSNLSFSYFGMRDNLKGHELFVKYCFKSPYKDSIALYSYYPFIENSPNFIKLNVDTSAKSHYTKIPFINLKLKFTYDLSQSQNSCCKNLLSIETREYGEKNYSQNLL